MAMASNDDSASLLVDERSSPPPAATPTAAGSSSPLRRLLHGGGKKAASARPAAATTTRSHDVKRFICSPFAAVFRAMSSCKRDVAVRTCDEQQQPAAGNNGTAAAERRREAARKKRPSLEQLLRMEAPPPPPPASSARPAPDHLEQRKLVGKPREAPYEMISVSCAVKGKKKEQEPPELFPSPPQSHFVAAVSDDDDGERRRRRTTIMPVKLEAGPGRQTNAKRLQVVVLASLRACSRAPRINDGKVAAAGGRAPGKAELFYYRPIPMGRRCRVQHLEESPSYGASSDLSSLLQLGQV